MCPLLCNAHGSYVSGECVCQPGWKGKECQLRHSECEVQDCHGHGRCMDDGRCHCIKGFKGEFCDQGEISVSWYAHSVLFVWDGLQGAISKFWEVIVCLLVSLFK